MTDLRRKVALVTGASSGVGWQTALRLADEGMRICVTARRERALLVLASEIRERGAECLVAPADVSRQEEVEHVVALCLEAFGRIDLVVSGAAVQAYDWFERQEWDDIARIFDVTCFGQMRVARAVLPHFRERESGHFICVGSMLALGAAPMLAAYTASKHALRGWLKSLALELHGSGIHVSMIQIPSVSTPMFDHAGTALGFAPQPVPPTYDTDLAAKAIVRCAKSSRPPLEVVPVWLQGKLLLTLDRWAPWIGRAVMGRFGAQLQLRSQPMLPTSGNLHAAVERGVGPYGSVPPTARWKRIAAGAALAASAAGGAVAGAALAAKAAGAVAGAALGTRRGRSFVRRFVLRRAWRRLAPAR